MNYDTGTPTDWSPSTIGPGLKVDYKTHRELDTAFNNMLLSSRRQIPAALETENFDAIIKIARTINGLPETGKLDDDTFTTICSELSSDYVAFGMIHKGGRWYIPTDTKPTLYYTPIVTPADDSINGKTLVELASSRPQVVAQLNSAYDKVLCLKKEMAEHVNRGLEHGLT